jgi:hypothetical protein
MCLLFASFDGSAGSLDVMKNEAMNARKIAAVADKRVSMDFLRHKVDEVE